jgi:hypothetical protein
MELYNSSLSLLRSHFSIIIIKRSLGGLVWRSFFELTRERLFPVTFSSLLPHFLILEFYFSISLVNIHGEQVREAKEINTKMLPWIIV